MAKQIIVLEKHATQNAYRVAFWVPVPAARQSFYANTEAVSQYKDATVDELAALKAGSVVEIVEEVAVRPEMTIAQMRGSLVDRWNALSDHIQSENRWVRCGTYWDGTGWTAGGVA
jgi:hypothetical protein